MFFDAVRVKIRDERIVRNKAVYLAIGVRCSGHKEILGLWIEQTEGAKFWLTVMNEIKHRGTEDILIAVVDGLKGFPEAIEAVFPKALDTEAAGNALDAFEAGPWGQRYPNITASWRRNWERVIPFFDFPGDIRRIIYTTNAIESLNSTVRKAVRIRDHFPSDAAAAKLIYLALRNVEQKWTNTPIAWHAARAQFAIKFEDRFTTNG